jgi:hypothetical protein
MPVHKLNCKSKSQSNKNNETLFLFILANISSDTPSSSFCLCTLKRVLEEYALFVTDNLPPRYHSSYNNDIGFNVGQPSHWKLVNNASWIELSAMINAPKAMYTHISLHDVHPVWEKINVFLYS